MVGGNIANSQSTEKCCRFDIYERKWYQLPLLNEHRANAGTYIVGDYLYAFGGYRVVVHPSSRDSSESLSSVECYNPHKDSWKFVKSMKKPRMA